MCVFRLSGVSHCLTQPPSHTIRQRAVDWDDPEFDEQSTEFMKAMWNHPFLRLHEWVLSQYSSPSSATNSGGGGSDSAPAAA